MNRSNRKLLWGSAILTGVAALVLGMIAFIQGSGIDAAQASTWYAQTDPDVTVLPTVFERISWGAIFAGTLFSLSVMFILNLFGIALGFGGINPAPDTESADPADLAAGSAIWVGVSNLVALFGGGWLAAYFAGVPDATDGMLHGLMVWAVAGTVTSLFVTMGIGRLMNGLGSLINNAISITGHIAEATGAVAGNTLQATGAVAGNTLQATGSAVSTVGSLGYDALSTLAGGVQTSAQMAASGVSNMTETAIEATPDVQDALNYEDLEAERIEHEVRELLRDAGKNPNRMEAQARAAIDDAEAAAQTLIDHPDRAGQILQLTLRRFLRRGKAITSDIDRQSLIDILTERTDMTEQDARQQVSQWENQFKEVKQQTEQARKVAREKAQKYQNQVEEKAQEIYNRAQQKVEEMQHAAEQRMQEAAHQTRETANAMTNTLAKLAAGIAAAMLVGALAATIGGYIGTPGTLEDIEIEALQADTPDAVAVSIYQQAD